jgi:hypothetical protein
VVAEADGVVVAGVEVELLAAAVVLLPDDPPPQLDKASSKAAYKARAYLFMMCGVQDFSLLPS